MYVFCITDQTSFPLLTWYWLSTADGKSKEDLDQALLKFALRKLIATDPCNYNRIYIIRWVGYFLSVYKSELHPQID